MNTHQGYAFLIVLLVTSFLVITVTTSGYKAFLLYHASCIGQRQLQHRKAGKGFLLYATYQAVHHEHKESDFADRVVLYQGVWPSALSKPYTGCAYAYKQSDLIRVCTHLYYEDKEVAHMSAQVNIDTEAQKATLVGWNPYATNS